MTTAESFQVLLTIQQRFPQINYKTRIQSINSMEVLIPVTPFTTMSATPDLPRVTMDVKRVRLDGHGVPGTNLGVYAAYVPENDTLYVYER